MHFKQFQVDLVEKNGYIKIANRAPQKRIRMRISETEKISSETEQYRLKWNFYVKINFKIQTCLFI